MRREIEIGFRFSVLIIMSLGAILTMIRADSGDDFLVFMISLVYATIFATLAGFFGALMVKSIVLMIDEIPYYEEEESGPEQKAPASTE